MNLPFTKKSNIEPAAPGSEPGFRLGLISFLAAGIGILAGVIAYLLYDLIALISNVVFYHRVSIQFVGLRNEVLGYWVIVVPAIGGLIVGLMSKYGSRKIRGHGIPEAMEAVLVNRSRIEPKVAILKPLSAAIAIGTGGPFGAEGPIIQTGGAFGSIVGQIVHTTAAERKVLLACGAGAGMAATFSTPIAGVILAIELLLFEFKSRSFIPLVISSTLATSLHLLLMGRGPMFTVGQVDFGIPRALPFYIILGILCGFAAVGFTKLLYWVEDQFDKLPFEDTWWPAIGGLALGVIGLFVPRVLGVGYDTISDILAARLIWQTLMLIMIFKSIALVVSLGSGTSGGLLAPMFMASAAMGGLYAMGINHIMPGLALAPGAFALVAMGAVFGAASRATFTFIIFAFEITRDYNSVLPLMLVAVIADGIAILLQGNVSIMTEKLTRRGLRIHTDFEPDVLRRVAVAETMSRDIVTVPNSMTVAELASRIAAHDPTLTRRQALPVINEKEELVGIITRGDLLRALERDPDGKQTVLEAGSTPVVTAFVDDSLYDAAARMLQKNVGRLPVVDRVHPNHLVGYLGRSEILAARTRLHEEEHVREDGWWPRKPSGEKAR